MTTADMVESVLWSWGIDSVHCRPLAHFVTAVMAPTLLLDLADRLGLDDDQLDRPELGSGVERMSREW